MVRGSGKLSCHTQFSLTAEVYNHMRNTKKGGFTLIEIIAVVMIMGILSTLAIPNFTTSQERAYSREAIASLKIIGAAERIYRMELAPNAFVACNCGVGACNNNPNGCNFILKLNLKTDNWTYAVGVGGGPSFTATASRISTGCIYTFTQNDADPIANGSCPP